jgi:hypothetical protein
MKRAKHSRENPHDPEALGILEEHEVDPIPADYEERVGLEPARS